jgi:signal transduction histidine kinase
VAVLGLGLIWVLPGRADDSLPELITNVSQVVPLLGSVTPLNAEVRLEGVVLGVDQRHGCFALRDTNGLLWLESKTLPAGLESGNRILASGRLGICNGRLLLGESELIEPRRNKGAQEQTARVFLRAGRQEFRLDICQKGERGALEVRCEGPGLQRRKIPASMLEHPDASVPGRFLPGIQYECFDKASELSADLSSRKPSESGVSTNFFFRDGVNRAVVRFHGFLLVPETGWYQFLVRAPCAVRFSMPFKEACDFQIAAGSETVNLGSLRPGQSWGGRSEPQWLRTEGTVKRVGVDGDRMQVELTAETGRMLVTLSDGDPQAQPMLLNSRVRFVGLSHSSTTLQGTRIFGSMLVPSMAQVTFLQAAETRWHEIPVARASNLLQAAALSGSVPAHLVGKVTAVTPSVSLMLDDGSGPVEVLTPQGKPEDQGIVAEVLGMPEKVEGRLVLRYAVYRPGLGVDETTGALQLDTIENLRRLRGTDQELDRVVRCRGVVTYVAPEGVRAQVQGESEGIYVAATLKDAPPLEVGTLCDFEGRVSGVTVSPLLKYHRCTVLSRGQLPEPWRPSWSQLAGGGCESQYVELQGVVLRSSRRELVLGMHGGEMPVRFSECEPLALAGLSNATVRVRGVVSPYMNRNREVQDLVVQAGSLVNLTVDAPPPDDLFALPSRPVADLVLFDPNASAVRFVKVSGQVIHASPHGLFLMEGTNGLRFSLRDGQTVQAGDQVELVGIPENRGLVPSLRQGSVRLLGRQALPRPQPLLLGNKLAGAGESTLVAIEATVVSALAGRDELAVELRAGSHSLLALLRGGVAQASRVTPESLVRVTGVYTTQRAPVGGMADPQMAALLLNSGADIVVLRSPPWWNLRHSLFVLGGMSLVLAAALGAIRTLRRRVEERTRALREEIAGHHVTERNLNEQTKRLEAEIEERKRAQLEIDRIHGELVDASRQAGQAEVAASVLHNVGNVLNSVNTSAHVLGDRVRGLRLEAFGKVAELINAHAADLGQFLTQDEKGRRLPEYFGRLAAHLKAGEQDLLKELDSLGRNIEHINEIVAMQQTYARRFGVVEQVSLSELADSALKLQSAACARDAIQIVRDYQDVPPVMTDRHRVLQILVNLLQNARHACVEGGGADKRIQMRIVNGSADVVRVEVSDNGVGIPPENMTKIFSHGFTTRKEGHGFGLHSAALAAKEMGGSVKVRSDGAGKGASFALELPLQAALPATSGR